MQWMILICVRDSNNTGSYKVFVCLYYTWYISSCTIVSGLTFIFRFKSKSGFHGEGVELYNG